MSDAIVGIIANPMSGRDVRRLAARASQTPPESKRELIARAVVGAVAAGAQKIIVADEPFRISSRAVENLQLDATIEVLDVNPKLRPGDTDRTAVAMREAGAGALVVLGGDGTNRCVARAWPDAPVLPLSTGTNNVFPHRVEATMAGAAAGLVASGKVGLTEAARRTKRLHVRIENEPDDLALIDAVLLVDDKVGNYMPMDPARIRSVVLARAEPASVGSSALGGLLEPCTADDDFGVTIQCVAHEDGGLPVLTPISPGLFRNVHVANVERIDLGKEVELEGPGVLAFDGDRERTLAKNQRAWISVNRDGPWVIHADLALTAAARTCAFTNRPGWKDPFDGAWSKNTCC